jgi:murein DD-endopeptidase MepM/ murein hydrolase activator NlpD
VPRHRLPDPPSASRAGRLTLLAAAAGALVAAGQTVVSTLFPTWGEPAEARALSPVALVADPPSPVRQHHVAQVALAITAIGSEGLLPDPPELARDATTSVDVRSLTKAVDIGQQLARQTSIIDAALAGGATEAHLFGASAFVRPTSGRLTSVFGYRWGTVHQGIDIASRIGSPIYAFTDGVVADAGPATGFGLWVVLRHPDGTQSVYGHVNRMFVRKGQQVRAGDEIAEMGNRGHSTGPHLHLEIWAPDGTKLNPIPWLRRHGIAY